MATTRVFKSGNSLAVRLPKEFTLPEGEVEIFRDGKNLVIREVSSNLSAVLELLSQVSDDFFEGGREELPPQERPILDEL